MSKFKIIPTIDKLFITISTFLIIYAWINFYIRDLWFTFFLSLIFTFACVFILFYLLNKKREKKFITKEHMRNIEENFLAFRLLSKPEKLSILKDIISTQGECKIKKDYLLFAIGDKTHQIILATNLQKLTQFDLITILENLEKSVSVLKIICCDFDQNLNTNVIKNLNIEIITKQKLFDDYFSPSNIFPNRSNLSPKIEKKKVEKILRNLFIPSKSKSYFLCGLILIFSSIILPYHWYYLIFGSTLLLFSIACKLIPYFKS